MTGRVAGKVALVTGAARGQGRSHAVKLAGEGASIIATDVCHDIDTVPYPLSTEEDLQETVRQVEAVGGRIVAAAADVRRLDEMTEVVDRAVEKLGRLDIVSANAGIASFGQSQDLTEEAWLTMIGINLTGVWVTTKVAIPHIVAGNRGGSIVLTSSTCGLKAYENLSHYVAAKHGVVGLMRGLALEMAKHSIRVNCLNPTQVDTPMIMNENAFKLFVPDMEHPTREDYAPASQSTNALPIPWVECEDVSNALLFLVSDEARYVTGVNLPVDAGCTLK